MRNLLLALLLCGCVARADGDSTMLAAGTWLHGRTEPPMAGVVVAVSAGGAPRYSTTGASGAWGVTPWVGLHTITVTAGAGWRVVRITHPVIGSATGNVLKASITSSTDLRADVVVYLAPSVPTVAPPQITAVATLRTPTATPEPTLPMPPVTPPLPTPRPLPTPPPGGWERWENPPAEIINAMVLDWEWWLEQFDSDDPLQFAVNATYGAAWPIGGPMLTPWMYAGAAVRWQCFVTPKGVVFAFATAAEPYRVALIEW